MCTWHVIDVRHAMTFSCLGCLSVLIPGRAAKGVAVSKQGIDHLMMTRVCLSFHARVRICEHVHARPTRVTSATCSDVLRTLSPFFAPESESKSGETLSRYWESCSLLRFVDCEPGFQVGVHASVVVTLQF